MVKQRFTDFVEDKHKTISDWHRFTGMNAPAVDIDFLLVEYESGQPSALIEYKHESVKPQKYDAPNYTALRALADAAGIPFFLVRYDTQLTKFHVTVWNENALTFLPTKRRLMFEAEYIRFLHNIRGFNEVK